MTNRSYAHPYPQDRDPLSKAWNSIASYISKEVSKEVQIFREFREVDYPKIRHVFQPVKYHVLNMSLFATGFGILLYFFADNPVPELPHIGFAALTAFGFFFIAGAYLNLVMCAYYMLRVCYQLFSNGKPTEEDIKRVRPNAETMVTHFAVCWTFQMLCVLMLPFAMLYCATSG